MKQVHWQLPFDSMKGVAYMIDIYDDPARSADGGQSWPVQLVGGAEPIKTDEDSSDDFFAPVRSQTGFINIVNTNGELSIYDMLPSGDIDNPVRVVRLSDNAIVWQGFLKCETYTQEYTDRPVEISIPIISMLEAMKSVDIEISDHVHYNTLMGHIANCFRQLQNEAGITLQGNIYWPKFIISSTDDMFDFGLYGSLFFDNEEYISGKTRMFETKGCSMYDVLDKIATALGCTVREYGQDIYIVRADRMDFQYCSISSVINYLETGTKPSVENVRIGTIDMKDLDRAGEKNTISVRECAKRVSISCSPKKMTMDVETPGMVMTDVLMRIARMREDYLVSATNILPSFDNRYEFKRYSTAISFDRATGKTVQRPNGMSGTIQTLMSKAQYVNGINSDIIPRGVGDSVIVRFVGAVLVRLGNSTSSSDTNPENTHDGLMLVGFDAYSGTGETYARTASNYIVKMSSSLFFYASVGYIRITSAIRGFIWDHRQYVANDIVYKDVDTACKIHVAVKVGNLYWNSTSKAWEEAFSSFALPFDEKGNIVTNYTEDMSVSDKNGFYIPINRTLSGILEILIYQDIDSNGTHHELLIDSLKTEYFPPQAVYMYHEGDNKYGAVTGAKSSQEVNVSTEITESTNNLPSPSLLMRSMSKYANSGFEETLLKRLKDYYSSPRAIITQEVRPFGKLPLLNIAGYDERIYLPMSESINWAKDTSVVKMFENP